MKKLWKEIVKFNDIYYPYWRFRKGPMFFAVALSGETGELCNKLKKLFGGGTNLETVTIEDLAEEAFDIIVYLVLFLESIGITSDRFTEIAAKKLGILYERMITNKEEISNE